MHTKVLIIGGGLTGLAIADQLHQAGVHFELVEANKRWGGRIYSIPIGDAYFDLGPTWIWPGQPLIKRLIERFKLTTFEQYSTGSLVFQDANGQVSRDRGYASMQGSYRIDGGVGALVRAFTASLPSQSLHLNTQVNRLIRDANRITAAVKASNETQLITADTVVLAVPPRIASQRLTFDPPLNSSVVSTLSKIPTWMAGHAKVLAIYDKPYWRDRGYSGDAMSQRGPLVEIHDASPNNSLRNNNGRHALFGFVGLPAKARRNLQHSQLLQQCRLQLDQLFGSKLGEPLELQMQDWAQQDFTATELDQAPLTHHPSYGRPSELNSVWDGRLMLACAELDARFGGLLEGALQAARYTSDIILKSVK